MSNKTKLIEKVMYLSEHYDIAAKSAALDAVRRPCDEKAMAKAREYVSLSDDRQRMAKQLIEAIHAYWPGSES